MRLSKNFNFSERYQIRLIADLYNVTNRGNLYSNPDNSAFVLPALTAIPKQGDVFTIGGVPVTYGVRDEISPGSTPFGAQLGVRFQF